MAEWQGGRVVGRQGGKSAGRSLAAGGSSSVHLLYQSLWVVCRLRLPVLGVGWCSWWWQCGGEVVGPCWRLLGGSVIHGCGLSLPSQVGCSFVPLSPNCLRVLVAVGCLALASLGCCCSSVGE